MTITGYIKNRNFEPDDLARYHYILQMFNGKEIRLELKEIKKGRSLNQNSYYWAVVIKYFQDGYFMENREHLDASECHEILKQQFNSKELVNSVTGEIIRIPQSTSQLSTMDFEVYLSNCREFIKHWFFIDTPLPNEEIK